MYQYFKSKLKWNPVTIRVVWAMLLAFCVVFWYYSFQAFDFVVQYITKFISQCVKPCSLGHGCKH